MVFAFFQNVVFNFNFSGQFQIVVFVSSRFILKTKWNSKKIQTCPTLNGGPVKSLMYSWNLARFLSTCNRYTGRWFNSNRWQVDTFASKKSGLRFRLYLLIGFLPALLGVDPNGTFVWCGVGRFTPFHAMFHGQHCLGHPLSLVGITKTRGHHYPMVTYMYMS